jgi:hypothetical protein
MGDRKYIQCPQTITEYNVEENEVSNFRSTRVRIEMFLRK